MVAVEKAKKGKVDEDSAAQMRKIASVL